MNTEESIKRKRGRPRKYRPDGTMVVSSIADVTITQATDVFSPTPPSSGSIPPPSGAHETVHSSRSRGATTPSRVTKLTDIHRSCKDEVSELTPSDMEKIQADCVPQIQSKANQFVSEYSDFKSEESTKRKGGRPRKYRPDGTMVVSSTADVTITQAPVFSPTPPSSGSIPPPSGAYETVHSSGSRGATTPSRVTKLTDIHRSCNDEVSELTPSDIEKIQADCVPQIQSKANQFVSEYSDFKSEESIKRKRGRPKKYRPDGTMVVSSTDDATITQAPDVFSPTPPSSGSIPPPSGAHETVHSSGSRGATTPSRVAKLTDVHRSCKDEVSELTPSDMEKIQADCVPQIQSKANQFVSECSDFKSEESTKRKGGRPRKYRPDGTMVVSSTADVTITQAPDVFSPTPPSSGSIPPPSGAHETIHSSGSRGATTPSRVTKLTDIHRSCKDVVSELTPSDMEKIQADCVPQIESKANQFVSEYSDFKSEESIKRKGGRPRKYRPDGTMVVSSTADVTITQAPDVFSPTPPSSGSIPPPSGAYETVHSSGSRGATTPSRVTKLTDIHRGCKDDVSPTSKANQFVSEYSDFKSEEPDKRKRGRPRKYRPDDTMASVVPPTADFTVMQTPDAFSPTPPSGGSIPPPSGAHETVPSSGSLDLATIRSQVTKLTDIHRSCKDDVSELTSLDMEKILAHCVLQIQSKADQLVSEYLDFDSLRIEDLDANLEHLKGELKLVEDENAKISNEIDVLNETYVEDLNRLESDLGGLEHSLNFIEAQGLKEAEVGAHDHCFACINDQLNLRTVPGDDNLEIMRLNDQVVKDKITLKLLHDYDCAFKRFDAVEKVMDALTDVKVLDFEGSCIRLSLRTYIPNLEGLLCQQKVQDIIEPSELNHELLIEVMDGTMELKNIEIFPNDVYIGEIIDAAKSLRYLHEASSSLKWSVSKVKDRIYLCTLRRYVIKGANKSRHSFEYLDRDEMIVAHIVDGVDAFIKVSQGWPLLNSSLKLVSLKSSDHSSRGISLSFLCKVEEVANSLDVHIRTILSSFVDAIEEILVQQMRLQLHSDDIPRK